MVNVSRATDEEGAVFRHMAISYMLDKYGLSLIDNAEDLTSITDTYNLGEGDIISDNKNAQAEISDMAWKMLKLCKEATPDLFENAGPSCVALGFCPENNRQNPACKAAGKITLDRLKEFIQKYN
jgi:hypothetical protein